ncbi:MAG: YigZ family protein [Gemmatimonadota bacterium]
MRGSRFHALAFPAADEARARDVLEQRARAMYDASHHCAAWRFRDDGWRALDAGEPSGSAGAPILSAIDAAGVRDAAVIVTRYFGGTKLGVGGLVRAYGDAAGQALALAPKRTGVHAQRLRIEYPYDQTAAVMRIIESFAARDVEHGFSADGQARIDFVVRVDQVPAVHERLREDTSGALGAEPGPEIILYRRLAGSG